MQKKTAMAAAGALVLSVAGGVSVLSLARTAPVAMAEPTVITQYVDQFGNPIDLVNPLGGEQTVIYLPLDQIPIGQITYEQQPSTAEAPVSYVQDESKNDGQYDNDEDHEDYEEHEDDDRDD